MLCRQHQHPYKFQPRILLAMIVVWTLLVSLMTLNPVMRATASSNRSPLGAEQTATTVKRTSPAQAQEAYGKVTLQFEVNEGQTDPQVQFLTRASGATVFLTNTSAVFLLTASDESDASVLKHKSVGSEDGLNATPPHLRTHALRMNIEGANREASVEGVNKLPGIVNYLKGDDPAKWHSNVPTFGSVRYKEVYPGVDVVYYGNQQQLEYDFVVQPGADTNQVALSFEGADRVAIDTNGDLLLDTPVGTVRQLKPVVYQEAESGRHEIESGYRLKGNHRVGFNLGAYDRSRPLVIDPVLAYSTYLGGTDLEEGNEIAVDSAGNAYVVGRTNAVNFPTSSPLQGTNNGEFDVFVSKLNATGSILVYSTYLGGKQSENGGGIAVDSVGNAYVTGQTVSSDFPTQNAFQPTFQNVAAFVTKLNARGSAFVYSTYLDSNGLDNGLDIATDASGNAYVTGIAGGSNFPTKNQFQSNLKGFVDAFLSKFSPDGSLLYSTYLGGDQFDPGGASTAGFGVAPDVAGNAYITGETFASNFPIRGQFAANLPGKDAFVSKFNTNASGDSSLVYSSYLGGNLSDVGNSIALDSSANAYITGETNSPDFPASTIQGMNNNGSAFVTKVNAAGSLLVYSTIIGGSNPDSATSIAVDADGSAHLTGSTSSANFPTANAFQPNLSGPTDAFVTKLNAAGSGPIYSTFLGGTDGEGGNGIVADATGNIYVIGTTASTNFPIADPFQSTKKGVLEAFVAKIGNYAIAGRVVDSNDNGLASVTVTLGGSDTATVETDSAGYFGFIKTTPDGEYNVTPFKSDFNFAPDTVHVVNFTSNRDLIFIGTTSEPTPSPSPSPSPVSSLYQFGAASFSVNEDAGQFQVIVTRSGNASQATSIEYATTDGTANDRGDYTTAIGKLRFNAGETAKSFNIFVTDDVYQEGNETINITLSNPSVGSQVNGTPNVVLTLVDNDLVNGTTNPIDSTAFFVRQHYIDFLNRAPDAGGLAFWSNNIDTCGNDSQCREFKRTDTSAAFFLSIEFQQTGFLVERMYRAAFNRFPQYREFLRDTQEIGHDLVVGQGGWQAQLAANQQEFADDFVSRANFTAVFAGLSNTQYVDALNANTTGSLSVAERNALIASLNAMTETRATVLKKVAEDSDFVSREFNAGFVLMEFIGYLRRNPNDFPDSNFDGFNFWLSKLDQFNGDFRDAEMVKAFLSSTEYRARFGPF